MKLSEIKEVYKTLEMKTKGSYGAIGKADVKEFMNWIEQDQELKDMNYSLKNNMEFPFDFDWIIEEYIEQSYLAE